MSEGMVNNGTFGSIDDYVRARDIANEIPIFSGLSNRANFEEFELAFKKCLPSIRLGTGPEKDEYTRLILQRIEEPARLFLANRSIFKAEEILKILSKVYKRERDFNYYYLEIIMLKMYDDESLEGFLRRLAVLVEHGTSVAKEEFDEVDMAHFSTFLNRQAVQRFSAYASSSIQDAIINHNFSTVIDVLEYLDTHSRFVMPRFSTDKVPRLGTSHHQPSTAPSQNYRSSSMAHSIALPEMGPSESSQIKQVFDNQKNNWVTDERFNSLQSDVTSLRMDMDLLHTNISSLLMDMKDIKEALAALVWNQRDSRSRNSSRDQSLQQEDCSARDSQAGEAPSQ